ncbi:protein TolA [Desulfovibrio ferrophilus]|uniref:Protein TolA n=2 Tax=Desulfovibrio ferrophilus TaxID=241368 RepID=A0A2Z6AYU9_9BACT|nr:protein TolA [Desulfovibrio ferrophilus]
MHVSLDVPVYTVELVTLQPKKGKPARVKKEAPPVVKAKPVPAPKPEPGPPISKPEAKVIADKVDKPKKPEAKEVKKPAPPKPKKPEKTKQQLLAEALAQAQKDVKWKERKEKKDQERAHKQALEDMRKLVDAEDAELEGMGGEDEEGAMLGLKDIYALQVKEIIQANWRYPSIPVDQSLSAGVFIRVGPGGHITEYSLLARSGRPDFDESVLKAVEETELLPPPPGDIREIRINFNLQDMR